jgi:bidirectional [NiFe] hydrogenase diaphorase subunit
MKKVNLTIDGKTIAAPEGEKLLWVALDSGIYIPNLCAIREGSEPAACRLCFVEVSGKEQPVTACTENVAESLVVNTRGERALKLARTAFELLMASHRGECSHCAANGHCELQKIARHLGVSLKTRRLRKLLPEQAQDDSHPEFSFNPDKCVLCGRCVWTCRDKLGAGVLGFSRRGFQRAVTTFSGRLADESKCRGCGQCVEVCPTGALAFKNRV